MPCYLTGSPEGDARLTLQEAQENATNLCEMLCIACRYIEHKDLTIPIEIQRWWSIHKKIDKKRKKTFRK